MEFKRVTITVSAGGLIVSLLGAIAILSSEAELQQSPAAFLLRWYINLWRPSSARQFTGLCFSALAFIVVGYAAVVGASAQMKRSRRDGVFALLLVLVCTGFVLLSFGFAGIIRCFWSLIKLVI
jgi:hypothetical protein